MPTAAVNNWRTSLPFFFFFFSFSPPSFFPSRRLQSSLRKDIYPGSQHFTAAPTALLPQFPLSFSLPSPFFLLFPHAAKGREFTQQYGSRPPISRRNVPFLPLFFFPPSPSPPPSRYLEFRTRAIYKIGLKITPKDDFSGRVPSPWARKQIPPLFYPPFFFFPGPATSPRAS